MRNPFTSAFCSAIFALLHTHPAGALTVDTGGTADVGFYLSHAIVSGNPAIAYQDETNSDLKFVRALDVNGSIWGAPVTVDSAGFVGTWPSLAVVNGHPAICYYDHNLQRIRFVRAADPAGVAWNAPVIVDTGIVAGSQYSMAVVDGNPAISYGTGEDENVYYVRATDANGSTWGAPILVDWQGNFDEPSMAVVDGRPAIAYSGNGLWYVRAANATGSAWGSRVQIAAGLSDSEFHACSLRVINGIPAISYHDAVNQDLMYVRALTTTGSAWRTPAALDSAGTVGWRTSLAIINGYPAIAYGDQTNSSLKYIRAANASGDAAADWGLPVTVDSIGAISAGPLMEVNGRPAISYYDSTNGDLKFIRATDAGGGTLWPADIAVEQPANSLIADGGGKSFGVVPVGTTADLVFTVKNPNSGSEDLTGLALTIDGPDSAEFLVIANPAIPVPGGAGSNFAVRYAPTTQGLKTATLHIASSAEGSKNPYDIILTGASVPEIVVEQPTGTPLSDGEGRTFPVAAAGTTADMVFTVKNPGGFDLTGLGITIDGPDAGEFSVAASPATPVAPGGSTSFTVRYTADSPGAKIATLHLASNVSGSRNPFDIVLTVVPGTLDPAFNPNALTVTSITMQPDGKILAGGYSNGFNRVLPDGSREAAFVPNVNFSVNATVLQTDGKIVIGGTFTMAGGNPHARIARLNPDGTVDGGFNLSANSDIHCLAQQKDGKILVGGFFNTLGGGTRNYIARLNADGSLDVGFNPNVNGPVRSIAVQADGKIVIGGLFSFVGGVLRSRLARMSPDGSLDTIWNPVAGGEIRSITVQPDGKMIIGGLFTHAGGFPRNRIARVNPDGSIDHGFDPNANGAVLSTVLQADGKILVAGEFTTLGGVSRSRIARLDTDGTADAAFYPNAGGTVHGVALQADGKILVGGTFTTVSGTSRPGFARLRNDPASQSLTAAGANRADWLRGGASPEVEQVSFELSTDGGNTYNPLGAATRIAGGWELTGLSLPVSGHLRARGRTTGGTGNASSGLLETVAAFASEAPEIVVEQPPGTDLADGGGTSFGDVDLGEAQSLTFTITNTGTANLAPLTITRDGADAAMFTISASPIAVLPGGSTSFTVRFAPTGAGPRTATLHIASNDGDENPFDLTLTGTGTLSSNADLSSLSLSSGPVTPAFAPGITSYGASVASAVTSITVTPTVAQSTATITVNGVAATSGIRGAPISLSVGSNTLAIVVTAGDGVTTMTYTITVTRAVPLPGEIEGEFDPRIFTDISALAVQPDAKILFGSSTSLNQPLARIEANGSVESTATFNPANGVTGSILGTVVQADGKILVSVGNFLDNPIRRLNADGSEESAAAFQPVLLSGGTGFGMALQSDGKVVLGGNFYSVNGQSRNFIARLLPNGAVESTATFNPGTGPDGTIYGVAVQADGKILLGGQFLSVNGQPRNRLARLNSDGTLESASTFDPGIGPDNYVYWVAVQPDGKILVGGLFSMFNGQPRIGLARLLANGALDNAFNVDTGSGRVFSVAQQADGKIVLAGSFTSINGQPRPRVARLNADGTLESTATFAPGLAANDSAGFVALQADGKILLTGNFEYAGGGFRGALVRLINDPALQSLTVPDNTRVQWARAGAAPEVEQVTFELSTDGGITWTPLGAGARTAGGWERIGLSLPASGSLRARGRTVGGSFNASSGLIEQVTAFPSVVNTPLENWRGTYFGSTANSGNAADNIDFDGDGLVNLTEFAFGLNPVQPASAQFPQWQPDGSGFTVNFIQPAGVSGITYGAEWSISLLPGSWTSIPDTGVPPQHQFRVSSVGLGRMFLRLKVTNP